jgi:hypothetical protein
MTGWEGGPHPCGVLLLMVWCCGIGLLQVVSVEDAKSELVKLFQEAWERENGYAWIEELPLVVRYAEDILRK